MPTTSQSFREYFREYQPTTGVFDELLDREGKLRPAYVDYLAELESLGRFEFTRRWTQAKRAVRDNGIAYSGYSGNCLLYTSDAADE